MPMLCRPFLYVMQRLRVRAEAARTSDKGVTLCQLLLNALQGLQRLQLGADGDRSVAKAWTLSIQRSGTWQKYSHASILLTWTGATSKQV